MSNSIYQFNAKDLAGDDVSLKDYEGKVVLLVNTASRCGFTPQLGALENLYQAYKDKGFEILAFPSNDFMGQEPLEGDAIGQFCQRNYGVTFKVFDKVHVKGSQVDPLYEFLSSKKLNGSISATPKWNFHKHLINKNGELVEHYHSTTSPTASKVKRKIDELLSV